MGSRWCNAEKIMYVLGAPMRYKYDGDAFDWIYLSMRWIAVARPDDVLVLPRVWATVEYLDFVEKILLDGKRFQVIWVQPTHYSLDEALAHDKKAGQSIKTFLDAGVRILPYSAESEEFQKWFKKLLLQRIIKQIL